MTLTKYISFGTLAALAVIAIIAVLYMGRPATPQTFGQFAPQYSPMKNTGVLCVNGASTLLIATSTSRSYLRLGNMSGKTIWLGMGVPAATSTGIFLAASSTIEFNQTNMFSGAIYCLGDSASGTNTVAEEK